MLGADDWIKKGSNVLADSRVFGVLGLVLLSVQRLCKFGGSRYADQIDHRSEDGFQKSLPTISLSPTRTNDTHHRSCGECDQITKPPS